jgi:fumarylacetoacetase
VSGFGLDHLPWGTFEHEGRTSIGVRYDDFAVPVERASSLNALLARGPRAWAEARAAARRAIESGDARLLPLEEVQSRLPFEVADYVDFYSSLEHASNMGRLFGREDPLLANWRHLPVGYHGRAGTVVPSGTPVVRPCGLRGPGDFGPSTRLDIELELAFVVGVPSRLGEPVPAEAFAEHVFGVVLLNDWSARDLQGWESKPLGPFLGKSFATSVGAWVTPLDALQPYRVAQPRQEPEPVSYLRLEGDQNLDVELEVELNGEVISRSNSKHLYWSMPQQLAHLTVNGASIRTGDLCATGTISGPTAGSEGSLMELWRNERFLEDGDEIVLRGRAGSVTLAEVSGVVAPSTCVPPPTLD